MSLSQLCDLAYAMQVAKIEERFAAVEMGFYFRAAQRTKDDPKEEMPKLEDALQRFDDWLNSEIDGGGTDMVRDFYGADPVAGTALERMGEDAKITYVPEQ